MKTLEDILVLNAVKKLTNRMAKRLVEAPHLANTILSAKALEDYHKFQRDAFLAKELELIKRHNISVVTYWDENYPHHLKQIPDAPIVLYVKGDVNLLSEVGIAIVGCREASVYGLSVARRFALELGEAGFHIISGLARGIDTAAHQGALTAQAKTIAVLGSGLAHIYPTANLELSEDVSRAGAVISEFPMQTPPFAYNFPRRNRIVSGLSSGVVVVEAAKRSGSLITADCALEQGREVYAVPGRIDNTQAAGTNDLIRQGAKIVTSVSDIVEDMVGASLEEIIEEKPKNRLPITEDEESILKFLDEKPIHFDQVILKSGQSYTNVISNLMQLEMKKEIKQLPGKLYVRNN